jgi:hypothetical protein
MGSILGYIGQNTNWGTSIEIHGSTFQSNTAIKVSTHKSQAVFRTFLNYIRFNSWPGPCTYLQRATAPSIMLGLGLTKSQK